MPISRPSPRLLLTVALHAVVALGVAVSIYAGHNRYYAEPNGGLCDTTVDCRHSLRPSTVCLQQHWGYCTVRCRSDADCPPTWRCDTGHWQGPLCLKP